MLMTIPMIDARGPLRCSAKYKARIFEEYEALNKAGPFHCRSVEAVTWGFEGGLA
jgi:hypothetical protein